MNSIHKDDKLIELAKELRSLRIGILMQCTVKYNSSFAPTRYNAQSRICTYREQYKAVLQEIHELSK